jgi:hypothetical protein
MKGDFDERLEAGLRDLANAVPSEPAHTLPVGSRVRRGRPRARTALPIGSLLAAGLIVLAAVVIAPRLGSTATTRTPSPSGTATGEASSTAAPAPSATVDATRYDDGIPRSWDGQPVLRGQARWTTPANQPMRRPSTSRSGPKDHRGPAAASMWRWDNLCHSLARICRT